MHRQFVVHAQAEGGRVDDFEAALQGVLVADLGDLLGLRVDLGVGGVDAVDTVLGDEDLIGVDFECALGGHGVCGEVRKSGSGAEDDDAVLLHVPHGAAGNIGFGDLRHRDRGLHTGVDTRLFEEVLQGQAVHDGAEHAHVVGAGAVHAALGEFGSAEEVAAADDDADLDILGGGGDLTGDCGHDVGIDADLASAEDLAGELEQNTAAMSAHRSAGVAGFVNRSACHGVLLPCGQVCARWDLHCDRASGTV